VLTVTDDGVGLPDSRREGGISGMRERAQLVDGKLELRRRPEGGTEVRLTVPLAARGVGPDGDRG
jgi:two-component system sensor histidine kinase UhpB